MNISAFFSGEGVYTDCECIKGCAFDNAAAWVKYAHNPVTTVDSGLLQDSCAHFSRVGYLLPHISLA